MDKALIKSLQHRISGIQPWTSAAWHHRYARYSAHLGLTFPQIPPAQHLAWLHQTLLNQQLMLAEEDGSHLHEIQWEGPLDKMMEILHTRPAIICTFHTGSYRQINHFLLKNCVLPYSLLVSREVNYAEGPHFKHTIQSLALPHRSELNTIVADQPYSALKIMRALDSGKHLLAYLDGNIGSDSRMDLRFLGLPFRVRYGLAYLAHRASVPLVCIIARRMPDHTNSMQIVSIIEAPGLLHSDPKTFAHHSTAEMYGELEKLLRNEPWQWDMWYHLHEFCMNT